MINSSSLHVIDGLDLSITERRCRMAGGVRQECTVTSMDGSDVEREHRCQVRDDITVTLQGLLHARAEYGRRC